MSDRQKPPTIDELQARIIVLETMVMAALGLAARRPTNFSAELIIEMLNGVKSAIGARLIQEGITQDGIAEARCYVDEVLSQFSESLLVERGPPLSPYESEP
jgi:hypothetical protein